MPSGYDYTDAILASCCYFPLRHALFLIFTDIIIILEKDMLSMLKIGGQYANDAFRHFCRFNALLSPISAHCQAHAALMLYDIILIDIYITLYRAVF